MCRRSVLVCTTVVLFPGLVLVMTTSSGLLPRSVSASRAAIGITLVAVIALGTLAFLAAAATLALASGSGLLCHLAAAFLAVNVSVVTRHV